MPDHNGLTIRRFQVSDEKAVISLWDKCALTRPWNDARKDIARKLTVQSNLFLVAILNDEVIGSVMAGYEGHRGWINYLAVAPENRGKGHARSLMDEAEQLLIDMGCPKINLQVRCENKAVIEFYQHIGFATDHVISLGKRLIPDDRPKT